MEQPNINFLTPPDLNAEGYATGDFLYRGFRFTFSLRRQLYNAASLRGTLTLKNGATNRPLQVNGETATTSLSLSGNGDYKEMLTALLIKKSNMLLEKFDGSYRAVLAESKLADKTDLETVSFAFLPEYQQTIKDETKRNTCSQRIKSMARNLPKDLGQCTKQDLLKALPDGVSAHTKEKYIKALHNFLMYVQEKQHRAISIFDILDGMLQELKKAKSKTSAISATKAVANSDTLSNDAEEKCNEFIQDNLDDANVVAMVMLKDAGLEINDICKLRICDLTQMGENCIFVHLNRQFSSATQDYSTPMFPWGSSILSQYLKTLDCTDPERLVFSQDAQGTVPLDAEKLKITCKNALQFLKFSYAALIGRLDLKNNPSYTILQKTYRYRLNTYAGIDKSEDEGAYLFMDHRCLSNIVQADHYRSFTGESGRKTLQDFVSRDQRFLPEPKRKPRVTCRKEGKTHIHTIPAPDNEPQQFKLTVDLNDPGTFQLLADHGFHCKVLKVEPLGK